MKTLFATGPKSPIRRGAILYLRIASAFVLRRKLISSLILAAFLPFGVSAADGERTSSGLFQAEFVEASATVETGDASETVSKKGDEHFDEGDFYMTRQGKRTLHRLGGVISLTTTNEAEKSRIVAEWTRKGAVLEGYTVGLEPRKNITVLRAPKKDRLRQAREPGVHRAILASLRARVEGGAPNPVFVDPESDLWLIPTQEIIMRLRPGADAAGYFGAEWKNARRVTGTTDQFVLTISGLTAEQLLTEVNRRASDAQILWVEPNFISQNVNYLIPNDALYPSQWHLNNTGQGGGTAGADVDAPQAWGITQGTNSIIAILDVGTEISHPDLNANLAINTGEISGNGLDDDGNGYIDDRNGWDFYANNNDPSPKTAFDNHGTPVAGVALAAGNNTIGVAGAAFMSHLLPIRIGNSADNSGSFSSTPEIMAQAIYYAAGRTADGNGRWRGADVLNMSIGTSPSQALSDALTWAAQNGRNGKGCPIFVSSGNGASGWQQFALSGLSAGAHTFRWEYKKDAATSAGDDAVWLDSVFFPGGALERFESGTGLPTGWITGGNTNWSSVTNGVGNNHAITGWDGPNSKAVRSGSIANNQSSYVEITKTVAAGTLLFWAWTSSQQNSDFFNFYADGTRYFHMSGLPSVATGVSYPANHPDAIAVGASTDFDYRADYSQYGAELSFVAPSSGGYSGISTIDRAGSAGYNTSAGTSGDYSSGFGGTSSASPLAAGVGALILSVNPDLTAVQVRDLMRSTADKIGGATYAGGFNSFYGYGRINANAAVNASVPPTITVAATDGLAGEPGSGQGTGTFTLSRTGSTAAGLSCELATVGGTANERQRLVRGWERV